METKNELMIYTDGGARGNPGPAAIGVVVLDDKGRELAKFGQIIGETTNNVAEYRAVKAALEWVRENQRGKNQKIKFFLDSTLVVNQLNGIFKVKESHLRDLIIKIRGLEQEIGGNVSYRYIPREKNEIADGLVNSSLDSSFN